MESVENFGRYTVTYSVKGRAIPLYKLVIGITQEGRFIVESSKDLRT